MITDKQRQRDYEYEADYQSKSRYSKEQWSNILESQTLSDEQLGLLKTIYASYNHAATLIQMAFHGHSTEDHILEVINSAASILGEANGFNPEVDYNGNEYWWYLFCWGKNTPDSTLELKLHPELTEAIGSLWPEMEDAYYALVNDIDRSLQTRFNQEDSVWMASAILLYEKYYRYPGISSDDILLMQYEVQTRAQKIYGQDVNANTITQICNADERGHRFNYLRDIYKYYRVSFPGEFDGDRERPEPENLDYNSYVYTIFGYMPLHVIADFVDHEYAHLVDESYVELNASNGFVRMAAFLNRQGGNPFSMEDSTEPALALRADGEDCITTFHMLADSLLKEYPSFSYARKASWFDEGNSRIVPRFCDVLHIENYAHCHASISIETIPEGDNLDILVALNLPEVDHEEAMLDIEDKCNMLTLMTAAPFKVEKTYLEPYDLINGGNKIKASVRYAYADFMTMTEENIVGLMSTSLQIFASYYTDICQNYYPSESTEDPLAAALGDKLIYKKAPEVAGPQVIYREVEASATTDFVQQALYNYERRQSGETVEAIENVSTASSSYEEKPAVDLYDDDPIVTNTPKAASSSVSRTTGSSHSDPVTKTNTAPAVAPVATTAAPAFAFPTEPKVVMSEHPDRSEQGFRLYPKNTLIRGPVKTGKYHEAITTAVGIIDGKDSNMMNIEAVSDVLEAYKNYVDSGRILHVSYPDICGDGYEGWMEGKNGFQIRDGIFKEFANRCAGGRYVVMMEEVDLNWMHLFGEASVLLRENRRQGTSSETAITLKYSKETFRLPSNLYIVATCDSIVGEDTITGAINQDFFVRSVAPDSSILRGMRVEGILLERLMATINLRLSYFLGSAYQLGEGFFLATPDRDPFISLSRVFREQIIPLMEKWLDDDFEKIRYVLGDNAKTRPDTIFYQEMTFRDTLFKGNIPDSFDRDRCIYQINEEAFLNPKSYIDIYD
ncbi:MAG: hypothetical protein Q4E53_01365 [Eubacteriales bacterium]|nr:hypothetical protein [Eubacteriales bacterium]